MKYYTFLMESAKKRNAKMLANITGKDARAAEHAEDYFKKKAIKACRRAPNDIYRKRANLEISLSK